MSAVARTGDSAEAAGTDRDEQAETMAGAAVSCWAELPYPGERTGHSFVVGRDHRVRFVHPDRSRPSGWRIGAAGPDLDDWLVHTESAAPLSGREPVLSYGSNVTPVKVLQFGTDLPAVNLACTTEGLAAVWCNGRREQRDPSDVPCTITAAPGEREQHAVTCCDPAQRQVLDTVEGRHAGRYDLVRLSTGTVTLEDGSVLERVLTYVGSGASRRPVLDEHGRRLLVRSVSQHEVDAIVGSAAATSGEPDRLGAAV